MLNAFFPTRCALCGKHNQQNTKAGLCLECKNKLQANISDGVLNLGDYSELERAVRAFKFSGRRELATVFGMALAQEIRSLCWPVDAVVPVPLHWLRRFERGYNQSALLAQVLATQLGLPKLEALKRLRSTKRQTTLPRQTRLLNVQNAFVINNASVRGKNIVLIDDVYTTGATMQECKKALLANGAKVWLVVVAKA